MLVAVLSVQSVLEYSVVRIKKVEDCLGIGLFTCCEYNQLEFVLEFAQKSKCIRSNTHMRLNCLTCRHDDR